MAKPDLRPVFVDNKERALLNDGESSMATLLSQLANAANDGAAATAGVPVGGLYRNGSVLQIRVS